MSPRRGVVVGARARFPRVSGDEPNKENRMSEITEFSPRERG